MQIESEGPPRHGLDHLEDPVTHGQTVVCGGHDRGVGMRQQLAVHPGAHAPDPSPGAVLETPARGDTWPNKRPDTRICGVRGIGYGSVRVPGEPLAWGAGGRSSV